MDQELLINNVYQKIWKIEIPVGLLTFWMFWSPSHVKKGRISRLIRIRWNLTSLLALYIGVSKCGLSLWQYNVYLCGKLYTERILLCSYHIISSKLHGRNLENILNTYGTGALIRTDEEIHYLDIWNKYLKKPTRGNVIWIPIKDDFKRLLRPGNWGKPCLQLKFLKKDDHAPGNCFINQINLDFNG